MSKLVKPYWIFLVNTLPVITLFLIMRNDYAVIESLLSTNNISLWKTLSAILFVYGICNVAYAVIISIKKIEIHSTYAVVNIILSISIIYFYIYNLVDIIPFNIPQWMIPGERLVYVGTFLMPTILYLIFVLVFKITSLNKKYNALISFGITILIPAFWYGFITLGIPSLLQIPYKYEEHLYMILMIIGTVGFIFFLIRGCYVLLHKKINKFKRRQLFWKIPLTLILPLGGLVLHYFFPFFGNFKSKWFFIIVVLNSIFICLPNFSSMKHRFVLFTLRSITYIFSTYFFIVFIPFLPLSVVAIVAFGSGILMLCPIALFMLHTQTLSNDWNFLKTGYSRKLLGLVLVISIMVIPTVLIGTFLNDKDTLNETLDYLYSPDYSNEYTINRSSLKKTLRQIHNLRDSRIDFFDFDTNYTPYIAAVFNKIVFNNLTISDSKINKIEQVFFNKEKDYVNSGIMGNDNVGITNLNVTTRYDKAQDAWISTLDIELTNSTENFRQEYITNLELPPGCWISDYYLYVNGVKEPGILSEKKSAMWIYNQIRYLERRDPGILYYLTGNRVEFKVFPFSDNEVRKTGIEFIHKEPFYLEIDGNDIQMGYFISDYEPKPMAADNKDLIYISNNEKMKLDTITRKPYYHFVIDTSEEQAKNKDIYINNIKSLIGKNNLENSNHKISFTNSSVTTFNLDNNLEKLFEEQFYHGGFYLDRAIKKILVNSYTKPDDSYPLIVVVSDNLFRGVMDSDYSDFKATYPESPFFYLLKDSGVLEAHSLDSDPMHAKDFKPVFSNSVYAYPNRNNPVAYLSMISGGEIVLLNPEFKINTDQILEKNWESGLLQQGLWLQNKIYPDTKGRRWKDQIKSSFKSRIMSPVTSYLVVENDAQRIMLKKKQEQVLNGKESLDLHEEEPQQMSEPGLLLFVLIFGLLYLFKKEKKLRLISYKT